MIHETEKRCPGAFEGRPEKILALEDYKQALQASSKVEEFCDTNSLYDYNMDNNWYIFLHCLSRLVRAK